MIGPIVETIYYLVYARYKGIVLKYVPTTISLKLLLTVCTLHYSLLSVHCIVFMSNVHCAL